MKTRYALLFALAFGLSPLPAAQAGEPVVVELFTSQGCSACPSADKLMRTIADDEDVIALSWSVSIWDYIGWEDTLAIPLSNERHSWYNRLGGSNMVYTPQIFIDGQEAFVGSRKHKINNAIEAHRGDASVEVNVAFDDSAAGWVSLEFTTSIPKSADVRIVFFDDVKTVKIGAGENRGRTLSYTNIVRGSQTLSVDEVTTQYRVDMSSAYAKNCDAFAILVQDKNDGHMLGAAVHRLRNKTS